MANLSSNLFTSLPSTPPPPPPPNTPVPSPPIPIPKYPPKTKRNIPNPAPQALKIPHRNTKYFKPVKPGVISSPDDDRAVLIGESGVSYHLPGAPFEFQYSYSEIPSAKPLAIREPAFLPFAPPSMSRPWTGKAPLKKSKKKIRLFNSSNPLPAGKKGVKLVEMPGPYRLGKYPEEGRTREEILGEPLSKAEIKMLIKPLLSDNRQVNLGRDGLTHNMLELVHTHWKRLPVCKVRCKGVPTVDMNNVCRHLEEKTGGKIIRREGGVVYLFRGRNYNYQTRPQYPVMLWKPAAPVYPKLIQEAPEGLTKAEADELREKGKRLLPICKLAKNGVYITLVRDVRTAFEGSPLVKVDCKGMHATDYKKLGAKLKDLVPCVLLSFDDEQILMWRGQNWKSKNQRILPVPISTEVETTTAHDLGKSNNDCFKPDGKTLSSSPKMMSLWKRAIESNKAVLLGEIDLGPDALLRKVEEFESISQATEHSYPALILSGEDVIDNSLSVSEDESIGENFHEGNMHSDDEDDENEDDEKDEDNENEDDEKYDSDSNAEVETLVPRGSLAIDLIAEKLNQQ